MIKKIKFKVIPCSEMNLLKQFTINTMTKSKLTTKDLNAPIVDTQQKKNILSFFLVIFYIYVSNNMCALQLCTHVVSYIFFCLAMKVTGRVAKKNS